MHRPLTLIVIPLALLFASCATEPLKQAGIQGEHTLGHLRGLVGAYAGKDIEAFMDRVAPTYAGRDALRSGIESVFAAYQSISLSILPRRMLVQVEHKGNIKATFTWEGEWKTAGGRIVKDGGRGTFALHPGTYKLLAIEGKSPFEPSTSPPPAR